MHVALVNRWYPRGGLGYGGVAAYNHCLGRELARLGHRVTVICARWSPNVPEVEDEDGVTITRILLRDSFWMRRAPFLRRYARALGLLHYSARVARKLDRMQGADAPDVVEFADVDAEGFAYLLRQRRARVVIRCHTPIFVLRRYHSQQEMRYSTGMTEWLEKFCIRHADALTAPSHDMAQMIARECGIDAARISVIPNAVDQEAFAVRKQPAGGARGNVAGQHDALTVLYVGRLERAKGVEVLAHAIPEVMKEAPQTRFVFIGEDRADGCGASWRQRLEAYLRNDSINGAVSFLGEVHQPALLQWYATADIAVVPSLLYESFSYTCAQAMAAGLPVVASRIGGVPETVDDAVTGLLVDPGDARGLTRAIILLAQNPELRHKMGQAGRSKVEKGFAPQVIAEKALEIYKAGRTAPNSQFYV